LHKIHTTKQINSSLFFFPQQNFFSTQNSQLTIQNAMIDNDLFAEFAAQHNPAPLYTTTNNSTREPNAPTAALTTPTAPSPSSSRQATLRAAIRRLQMSLCDTHIALEDAMPLVLARPELGKLLESAEHESSELVAPPPQLPSVRFFAAALVAAVAVGFMAMPWRVVLVLCSMSAGAFSYLRFGRFCVLTRVTRAQECARKFAFHVATLDRATVRALRVLLECEVLARGRRISSTLVSQMDDVANVHRNAVLLAAVASAIARVRRALSDAVDDWRARLHDVACVQALATVSDRRVASLQGQIAAITDEYVATLDSLAPTHESPTVTFASLKQLHHVNCAIRSHLMTLLLLAADDSRRAPIIAQTLDRLTQQLAPLSVRIDGALDTFVLVTPAQQATAGPKPPPASPARRSRLRFQTQLADSRNLVGARLASVCELLRQTHVVSEQSGDADVTADDVNGAYRQFRRVRDELREAMYEWERAHAPLASVLSADGGGAWRQEAASEARNSAAVDTTCNDSDSDDASRSSDDANLLVDEQQFEHDGAAAEEERAAAPLTREERMARMAQRQAEREERDAAQAKQRKTLELMDELSEVLQQRHK
jgi:hypothetical protein